MIKVYFDACCFLDMAQMEMSLPVNPGRAEHVMACKMFLKAARAKPAEAIVYTSTVTTVECAYVVDPSLPEAEQKIHDPKVQKLFTGMLQSGTSGVTQVSPTPNIAEDARLLRWKHGITCKPMDALHVASARKMGCTHFFTTDTFNATNVAKLGALGLTVVSADKASSILPSKFSQIVLPLKPTLAAPASSQSAAGAS